MPDHKIPLFHKDRPHAQAPMAVQVLFASPSPLAAALGLSVLGFGFHGTKRKRTFAGMKPWSLPFWSVNWVSSGGGWFESGPSGRLRIRAGEAVLRFPNEPCRYGHATGGVWDEYWLLFDGALPVRLADAGLFDRSRPVLRPRRVDFTPRFEEARVESLKGKPRVQDFAGLLMDLLFNSLPNPRRAFRAEERNEDGLRRFYELLHARVGEPMDRLADLAAPFGNYHSLRRAFQKRYGRAPHQVLLEAKLLTARRLLLSTPGSLAEISARVGVEDVSYFIRLFRKRFNLAPERYRKQAGEGS